jgi:hypothetical protein
MLTLLVAFLVAFTALLYGVCRSCLFFGRHASVIRGSRGLPAWFPPPHLRSQACAGRAGTRVTENATYPGTGTVSAGRTLHEYTGGRARAMRAHAASRASASAASGPGHWLTAGKIHMFQEQASPGILAR